MPRDIRYYTQNDLVVQEFKFRFYGESFYPIKASVNCTQLFEIRNSENSVCLSAHIAGVSAEWLTVVKCVMNTILRKGWEFLIQIKTCNFFLDWT